MGDGQSAPAELQRRLTILERTLAELAGAGASEAELALFRLQAEALRQQLVGRGVQAGRDVDVGGDVVLGDKIERQINTGGGAYIAGAVRTGGGDFVGRDRSTATGPVATGGSAVSTGSGVAFVGDGNTVITGKVGGDVRVGGQVTKAGGGQADFLALVAQLRQQAAALASPADRVEATAELDQVVALAQRAAPPGGRIGRALANVAELVTGDRSAVALVDRASRLAQALWG